MRLWLWLASNLDESSKLITLALQAPSNEIKELNLGYYWDVVSAENYLMPALKHPDCNLVKLCLLAYPGHEEVGSKFRKCCALFVLLQGQQVRRQYCPLRRLPVEMFRLVGKMLL